MRCDSILSGGLIVDGTGVPAVRGDVGIAGGRITAVGDLSRAESGSRIDCTGRIVAPGFIDAHTHDDAALLEFPDMPMKTSQGVTTVVAGNCGVSVAPVELPGDPPPPLDLLGTRATYRFPRFADWRKALSADPAAVNSIGLVGHSALRIQTMSGLGRPADAREEAAMARLVEGAMADGALGLSTGLFYAPAKLAPTREVIALAKIAGAAGGIYATHLRNESEFLEEAVEEALTIGREANAPVVLSHHKAAGLPYHGKTARTLPLIDAARKNQRIALDVYPYVASSTILTTDRPLAGMKVVITWSKAMPEARGRELAVLAAEHGLDINAMAAKLQPAGAIYFAMSEDDVRRVLAWPEAMIGSDGLPHDSHPHPRLWGTFPRVLGHYSRDLKLFPLEEAVRRMTSLPARRFGLSGRGVLRAGAAADIAVFDAASVIDRASFEAPTRPAAGIDRVFVNGACVWEDGAPTGRRPGRCLALDAAALDYAS
ncbi:MAG: D-aminoacylase [Rhodospirillales bacterium]|nr:D-aminoacylase [Rhodospirillales bacterium]